MYRCVSVKLWNSFLRVKPKKQKCVWISSRKFSTHEATNVNAENRRIIDTPYKLDLTILLPPHEWDPHSRGGSRIIEWCSTGHTYVPKGKFLPTCWDWEWRLFLFEREREKKKRKRKRKRKFTYESIVLWIYVLLLFFFFFNMSNSHICV